MSGMTTARSLSRTFGVKVQQRRIPNPVEISTMPRQQDDENQGGKGRQGNQGGSQSKGQAPKQEDDPIVKTRTGEPDLRIKENREKFLIDPTKKATGEEDFRFKENRPDLQELEEKRGTDKPNMVKE